MAFVGGSSIEEEYARYFEKEYFVKAQVQESSYDLSLGEEYYLSGRKSPENLSEKKPYLNLQPGQFAILTCHERLHLPPDVLGFITLRNRYKMQGLINISGFHVDPGFKGRLVFAVQNVGPNDIRLRRMDPTFTIFFAKVENPKTPPKRNERDGIQLEDIQRLGGNSITLSKLKKEIETIRTALYIYAPFAIALFIALIMNIIKSSGGSSPGR